MSRKTLTLRLGIVCAASALVFAAALAYRALSPRTARAVTSAIVNPSNAGKIDRIVVWADVSRMELYRTERGWFAKSGFAEETGPYREKSSVVRAEEKLVRLFIERAARLRQLHKIASDPRDWNPLGLHEKEADRAEFSGGGETFTRAYFGVPDGISGRRALRTAGGTEAYETEDDLSQFLTADIDYWAAGELFAGIGEEDVQTVAFSCPSRGISFTADAGGEGFADLAHSASVLRHGPVVPSAAVRGAELTATLVVRSGNGVSVSVGVYEAGGEHFLVKTESPATDENAAYEISGWTLEKMFSLFS